MTRDEILAKWKEVGEALGHAGPAAHIPEPLEALSWARRAANGHQPCIERVLAVSRFGPAPCDLDDLLGLAICKAVTEAHLEGI